MVRPVIEFRTIKLPALVCGNVAILLDRHGRAIGRNVQLSRINETLAPVVEERLRWELVARRMAAQCFYQTVSRRPIDPWVRKANTLERSFYLRSFDLVAPTGKCRFEEYRTHTWEEAAKRLWHQANNRARRHSRGGWIRWAHTVSKNHNKRKGSRYGKAKSHYSQDDS